MYENGNCEQLVKEIGNKYFMASAQLYTFRI